MRAERLVLETDDEGKLKTTPRLPPRSRFEAIFLVLEETPIEPTRSSSPELAASIQIVGDLIAPAISPDEWDALR